MGFRVGSRSLFMGLWAWGFRGLPHPAACLPTHALTPPKTNAIVKDFRTVSIMCTRVSCLLVKILSCFESDAHVVCSGLAKELWLQSNEIGDMGAEKIAEALPTLINLEESRLDSHVLVQSMSAKTNFAWHVTSHNLLCKRDGMGGHHLPASTKGKDNGNAKKRGARGRPSPESGEMHRISCLVI